MFKDITINLTEPVCTCEEKNLSWGFSTDNKSVFIRCETCKTLVFIPREKLTGNFHFDEPYPADLKPSQKPKPKVKFTEFKRIIIELAGPICTCEEKDLAWNTGDNQLDVFCKTCKIHKYVDGNEFRAAFNLVVPYPGKLPEASEEEKSFLSFYEEDLKTKKVTPPAE
jgi:hypothetical protein